MANPWPKGSRADLYSKYVVLILWVSMITYAFVDAEKLLTDFWKRVDEILSELDE